jgi:hypothetical protein
MVSVPYEQPQFGGLAALLSPLSSPFAASGLLGVLPTPSPTPTWRWVDEKPTDFLSKLEKDYVTKQLRHKDSNFASFIQTTHFVRTREETPPILMTGSVWAGYRRIQPQKSAVQNGLFKKIAVEIPGYTGEVFGGGVIFPDLGN